MVARVAVIAVGGNSLIDGENKDITNQWATVRETCRQIAQMVAGGWNVVITHGNGPQVGDGLLRSDLGEERGLPSQPLDLLVAETQGGIGYMLQQAMANSLRRLGITRTLITLVTQVRVDPNDPAFANPTKPIGRFMSEAQARLRESEGWQVMEDAGRGWRRAVASPRPQEIVEMRAIRQLVDYGGYVLIACGGGGVPVIRNESGSLRGVPAVIDKDFASSLLAQQIGADLLLISTGVEQVALNYGKPDQRFLQSLSLREAEQYIQEGHFPAGSMLPKVEAAVEFIRLGGPQAIITNPPNLLRALYGETGTTLMPG